ncbi:Flagellar protein FliO [Methylophilaceae bacterium]|nr:Flagellar protein FliO [Methylophilaceae bacterium]
MNARILIPALLCLAPALASGTETASISPAGSAVQVVFGLLVVLGVMLLIAWLFKRYAPGMGQNGSVARIIGGVNLGNRERVVVIEVADRWLVVGVAPGQVNGIANLEAGPAQLTEASTAERQPVTNPFAKWLAQSINKSRQGN